MLYRSTSSVKGDLLYFIFFVYTLLFILLITFNSVNLLMFYFFFEASLIPTLLIIMGWGYQPERLQAGLYFLFYTLTASLPLLMVLLIVGGESGVLDTCVYINFIDVNLIMALFFVLAFFVKLPIFFVHLWLPKAHVEAPVAGSMILAGVLLKLGGYGLIRVLPLSISGIINYSGGFYGLRIAGIVFVGVICCRLNDLKALVAYSSVAHMALVLCGSLSYSFSGIEGALIIIIRHGLSSSGLFCIVNIYYERRGSRRFFFNRGLLLFFPIITIFFFILCASNIAAPPTINLLSEIFLIIRIIKFDYIILFLFPLGSFLGAVFTLFIFSFSQHGAGYLGAYSLMFSDFREFHCLLMHILPLNFVIIKSEGFLCFN